jgi:hypothetical protein
MLLMLFSTICLHLKEAMFVCALYHLTTLFTRNNMKEDSYILAHLKGKIAINLGINLYILSKRCYTLRGYRCQNKCNSRSSAKFELAIMQVLQKLAASVPCISVGSAAK